MSSDLFSPVQKYFNKASRGRAATFFNVREEASISSKFLVEDAPLFRSLYRAKKIAGHLLKEAGGLSVGEIKKILPILEDAKGIKYVDGFFDEYALDHMIRSLQTIAVKPKLLTMICTQKAPAANPHVQRILLRSTGEKKLTDLVIQRAILSALLTPLRQNVGSCFATAPCILIQSEQLENFLLDITTLISTGKLVRVYEGKEFVVPMSLSGGIGITKKRYPSHLHKPILSHFGIDPFYEDSVGRTLDEHLNKCKAALHLKEMVIDMTDHALLKAWEFTIASFSDFKTEIFKWNLYASLGFDQKEPGGIGQLLYQHLDTRLQESNEELEKVQGEYEHAYMRVKMTENLLRQADSPEKARRVKAEHASNVDHFYACQEQRDELHNSSERYAQFFTFLLKTYSSFLPHFFQELYDADMIEVSEDLFEDAPAGFRLLFKHGRSDPSAWTFIYTERLFSDALEGFFRMTERDVIEACEWEKGKKEIESITTKLIYHVRDEAFVRSAFERIRKFHAKYGIESGKFKTPWSYVSGGTLPQLLQCYYGNSKGFTEENATTYSGIELLTFYLDMFKELPPRLTNLFDKDPRKRMLGTSPNHVFTLMPGLTEFAKAWGSRYFTYSWIRDTILKPAQDFYRGLLVDRDTLEMIWLYIGGKKPRSAFQSAIHLSELPSYFAISKQKVDGILRAFFPLVPKSLLPEEISWAFDMVPYSIVRQVIGEEELHKKGYVQPKALVFGDTNWSTYFFAFVVNPTTLELELWRTDPSGSTGVPMSEWDSLFKNPSRPWSVFWEIKEYGQEHISALDLSLKKV